MAGLQWYNSLRAKYAAVLPSVPGLLKLARRLCVDGEETLRECFLAGVQTGTAPIFAECMPESELAMTESALEEAFKALQGGQAEATAMAARRPKKRIMMPSQLRRSQACSGDCLSCCAGMLLQSRIPIL